MTADATSRPSEPHEAIAIECRNIRKEFPGVLALSDVSVSIRQGEIHALLGQNGAGKSTLVKVLTGVYQHDGGEILIDGRSVRLSSPRDAEANGIAIVHQDQQLVSQFDVTRNVFLGIEKLKGGGILDLTAMRSDTFKALDRVGASFSPDTLVRDLTVAQRELVSIAAALIREPRILVLDEPTASLSDTEAEMLFSVVRGLRDEGVTIVYISHYLDEVLELVDRLTVLRDGRHIDTKPVEGVTRADIVNMMVGKDIPQLYPKEDLEIGDVALEIRNLCVGNAVHNVDLDIRKGEIFGLAGLVGAGRSELALALIGALKRDDGTVTLNGKLSKPRGPLQAKREGFALIPEDRRNDGLITEMSMRQNLTLPNISRWSRAGFLQLGKEKQAALDLQRDLSILPSNINTPTRNMSGGNQQKVVIGRWLPGNAEVFLFDEPTTGVDVGSKTEIYREMTKLAQRGAIVIFISSDFEEIAGMCDRVAVMSKGRVNTILQRDELDVPTLLYHASGGAENDERQAGDDTARPTGAETQSKTLVERGLAFLGRWGTVAGMVLALAMIAILAPQFLYIDNVFDVLKQGSVLAFIALGLAMILIAGGLDMSAGALSQLSSNLAAGFVAGSAGIFGALAIGLAAGLAVGVLNAALVLFFSMHPFVATLGMMFVTMGATLLFNGGQALTLSDQPVFFFFGQGYIGPVPVVFIFLLIVGAFLHLLLRRTRLGLRMHAVGQNLAAAELRGITRPRYAFASFVLGGLILGLAGVVLASYSYGASALATGIDFLITALAAAFLGSTFSRSGELNMPGTIVAALFLASLSNGLILIGVSNQALPGIQGLILILSIAIGVVRKREIGQVLIF